MIISACSDEISTDLAVALAVLESEQIQHVDLRGIWGGNVTALSDEQADQARQLLRSRGFTVTAISTPVGKTKITDDFAPEVARFRRAVELARLFEAPYIRVFSFYATEEEAKQYWPEAVSRLHQLCALAQPYGITLAHENEEGGFVAWRPAECLALQQALPANFRTLFEPCSFTVMNYDAYQAALPLLRDYIAYVHIRDTRRGTTQYSVAGEGDVQWHKLLADLKQHQFAGYLTLEPHLGWDHYGQMTDEVRTANFRRATKALRNILAQV